MTYDLNVSIWVYLVRGGRALAVENSGVVHIVETVDDESDVLLLSFIYYSLLPKQMMAYTSSFGIFQH